MTVESRSVVVRLSAETAQYIREMQAAGKVGADAMSKVEKNTLSASQAQDRLAGGAGKVALAGAVALGGIVSATSGFDQAMSKVQAATHETETGMRSLREAALEAGADTAFSADEAAAGIENLAKAGVSTQDILGGGLTGALDLAAAGELGVADAAEAAAGAMAQFNLDGSQAVHVADLLAAGAGKAQGDVSDMVLALKQAGTVASQTGLSLEETVGALSAMAEQSLLGSDAGTSFKTMLASLTPNSVKAAEAMEQYNIHAFDAQGNFIGMTALAGQLRDGLGDLTDEQRAMALETIFGSDAVRAAAIIYDNGAEGVAKWTSQVNDAGFAAETASIKQDNLRGDLEKLGGAFQTALIGSGEGSTGALRSVTQGLTKVVDGYAKLPPSAQSAATAVLATGTAVGGSIWAGTKIIRGIESTREALDNLGPAGATATKAMKGVAAAGAGLAVLVVAAEGIKAIQRATDETLPGLETLEGRLIDMANLPEGFSGRIGEEFDSIGTSIDRITDPGRATALSDTLQTPFEGLFGEAAGLRRARAEIDSLDQALASLVSSGNADLAGDALSTIAEQYNLSEGQLKSLTSLLPGYNDALAGQANEAKLAARTENELADASQGMGSAMAGSTPLTKEQAKALADARKEARDTASGFITLGDSLDDSSVSLGDWIKEMEDQADALANFTENAKKAAKNGLRDGLIQALEDAGPAGALRLKQLANASDAEIDRANRAWKRGQQAIDDYVDAVVKVPGSKSTTLNLKAIDAIAGLIAFRNRLDEATKDRIFSITTVYKTVRSASDALPDRTQRKAGGGQVFGPGTTTSDDILARLSNKEYVVRAAAVDHYGVGFFDDANAMRLADGGPTDKNRKRKITRDFDFSSADELSASTISDMVKAADAQRAAAESQAAAARIAARAAEDQLDAAQKGFDTAEKNLDAAEQMQKAFRDSVASQFSGSLTGGGLAGLSQTLDRDINGGSSMDATLRALAAAGLDTTGPSSALYRELAASEDLTTANELLAAGPAAIEEFERKVAERDAVNARRAEEVSAQAYGPMIAQQEAAVALAQAQLNQAQAAESAADQRATALSAQVDNLTDQVGQLAGDLASAINSTVRPGRNR